MAKGFFSTLKTYRKNVVGHVRYVASGKETLGHAVKEVRSDSGKLLHSVSKKTKGENSAHKRAVQFTKQGREFYNNRNFEKAERAFRNAAVEDPAYARPLLFLGNTLYKMSRASEAVVAWRRAYEAEPSSEVGQEAQRRIELMEKQKNDVVKQLEERIRSNK